VVVLEEDHVHPVLEHGDRVLGFFRCGGLTVAEARWWLRCAGSDVMLGERSPELRCDGDVIFLGFRRC
jgi:hypothetical protein